MSSIAIVVGRRYRIRSGKETVEITGICPHDDQLFEGHYVEFGGRCQWDKNGRWNVMGETQWDLVEAVNCD
ncbi:hypothetical protein EVB91_155 [Rhizobium phage RHph_I1_18]|nr:hypothetical protein EVB91_155 [Rhizobium phage RHph_I1_18]